MTPDVLALLTRVYASENGYRDEHQRFCHRIPSTFTPAERRQLIDANLQPNTFVTLTHDESVARLRQMPFRVDLRKAADAFVASMVSSDLSWQSILPAVALGLAMPTHDMEKMGRGNDTCCVCFYADKAQDRTALAYSRCLSGSSGGHPIDGVLALDEALAIAPWPQPSPRDVWVFYRVLDLLRSLPASAGYGKARSAIEKAKLLRSPHRSRCLTLLEALAFIVILETREHPGILTRFTSAIERDRRPRARVEPPAPLAWWTAADGINDALLQRLFGHLQCPLEEPPAPGKDARKKAVRAKPARPLSPKSVPGPVAAGDVYALRFREDLWGAAYCHEVQTDGRGVVRGRMEYLDILSPTMPTAEQIANIGFRDRHDGRRWQSWCHGLDKTAGVKRIAVAVSAPPDHQPVPERIVLGAAKDLQHLASWHFRLPR